MPALSLEKLYEHFLTCSGVFTDTRAPIEGGMFFALSGPNFNGNQFAEQALEGGAAFVVIDDPECDTGKGCLLVEDALEGLQQLAQHHRMQFDKPVIGLTGSNGKTTTKELMAAVLEKKYNIVATRGNLNNHIGVPLTLLRIKQDTEMAIIEMGANHVGEIKVLAEIARPTFGMITNIGRAHIEGFGGVEGIKKGKGELYDFIAATDGVLFINQADDVLREMVPNNARVIGYNTGDDRDSRLLKADPFVQVEIAGSEPISTQLIGQYNFNNLAAAVRIGQHFGVEQADIKAAIEAYVPDMNRSEIIKKGSNIIILDAYNANPDSMLAALNTLKEVDAPNKVVILGDMLELGTESKLEHRRLGQLVAQLNVSRALFCGELVDESAREVSGAMHFPTKTGLMAYLERNPIKEATVLLKASRGIGLESVVNLL